MNGRAPGPARFVSESRAVGTCRRMRAVTLATLGVVTALALLDELESVADDIAAGDVDIPRE
jgi:hypothetical protein